MTTIDQDILRAAKRGSMRAAGLTAAGVVIVFAVFVYSVWHLNELNTQIDAKQSELTELENRKNELQSEIAGLQEWRDVAVENAREQSNAYREVLSATEKLDGGAGTVSDLVARAPIETVAQPYASAVGLPDKDLYDFKLWLVIPPERRAEVRSVSYYFPHPSFRNKVQSSADVQSDFAVGYRGWGSLREVIITIHQRDGREAKLAFDMASAVNASRPSPIDVKGGVPTKGDIPMKKVPIK